MYFLGRYLDGYLLRSKCNLISWRSRLTYSYSGGTFCNKCHTTFSSKSSLVRHVRRVHRLPVVNVTVQNEKNNVEEDGEESHKEDAENDADIIVEDEENDVEEDGEESHEEDVENEAEIIVEDEDSGEDDTEKEEFILGI